MPYKARHPCKHPGCPCLVPSGQSYCLVHLPSHKDDYARKNPEYFKLYNNKRWRRYRRFFLMGNPLCINYNECHNAATVVDHKEDHMGDWEKFWNTANHQPMCKPCHDKKTAKTRGWGKI